MKSKIIIIIFMFKNKNNLKKMIEEKIKMKLIKKIKIYRLIKLMDGKK